MSGGLTVWVPMVTTTFTHWTPVGTVVMSSWADVTGPPWPSLPQPRVAIEIMDANKQTLNLVFMGNLLLMWRSCF
jgi:hypothetical protein